MRIKSAVLAACLLAIAQPAAAFDRMLYSDCQAAFEQLDSLFNADASDTALTRRAQILQSTRVTPDGWCQMRGGDQGLENAEFDELEWRAEGITRWTRDNIPPLAVELRITGLDPDEMQGGIQTSRPPLTAYVLLRQLPDAGQVIVERAVMDNDAGDSLAVSGVFERVFLSSPSMAQVSLGSATFKAGLFSMALGGEHENPFGFDIDAELRGSPQAQRDAAFDLVSQLPDGVVDAASRAELTAFAGDLPKPVGTLEVSVMSERGFGIMQAVGAGMQSVLDGPNAAELEILLDGLSVDVDWTPAAQVAD